MTQTKGVITKRMANKKDFNITGTGGKVANIPTPIPNAVINTPIAPKPNGRVEPPLEEFTVKELKAIAKADKVEINSKMNKAALVEAIRNHRNNG